MCQHFSEPIVIILWRDNYLIYSDLDLSENVPDQFGALIVDEHFSTLPQFTSQLNRIFRQYLLTVT